jgi:hypothetical protein
MNPSNDRPSDKESSATPRTDAIAATHDEAAAWVERTAGYNELLEHARDLEREIDQWRAISKEASRVAPSAEQQRFAPYWIVECAKYTPRRYWTMHPHRANTWETDPAKAIRYATRDEAMRVVMGLPEECEACEHMDCGEPGPVLDKPALIGATRFGVGVKWSTVIDRAQREYEYRTGQDADAANLLATIAPSARERRSATRLGTIEECASLAECADPNDGRDHAECPFCSIAREIRKLAAVGPTAEDGERG